MTPILALDLGNYKTVACSYDPANTYTGMTNASGGSMRIDGTQNLNPSVEASGFGTNPTFLRGSGNLGPVFVGNR
jgi:hypothetical protein